MLRNGAKEEDIAKAFTDKLNNAIRTVESEAAYERLAGAWNDAVDVYCRINKIPGAKEYYADAKGARDLVQGFIELGNFINSDTVEKIIKDTNVVKDFFKQIGI